MRRSFIRGEGHNANWLYLEAEPPPQEPVAAAPMVTEPTAPVGGSLEAPPPADRSLLYWLIAAALVLALVLFISRRQAG